MTSDKISRGKFHSIYFLLISILYVWMEDGMHPWTLGCHDKMVYVELNSCWPAVPDDRDFRKFGTFWWRCDQFCWNKLSKWFLASCADISQVNSEIEIQSPLHTSDMPYRRNAFVKPFSRRCLTGHWKSRLAMPNLKMTSRSANIVPEEEDPEHCLSFSTWSSIRIHIKISWLHEENGQINGIGHKNQRWKSPFRTWRRRFAQPASWPSASKGSFDCTESNRW